MQDRRLQMGGLEKIKEIEGAALGLQIYPTHILAHDANGHQLQATQQEHRLQQGRKALDSLAPNQGFDQKNQGIEKSPPPAHAPPRFKPWQARQHESKPLF
jgi:hypothetical protein